MNTKNNKKRRESRNKIESAFLELIKTKELDKITVTEICKKSGLNRTTFYSNYTDIYNLADCVCRSLEVNFEDMYRDEIELAHNSNNYLKLFRHIKQNQDIYKIYFKLGYEKAYEIPRYSDLVYDTKLAKEHFDNAFIEYHCEFFRAGLTAIIKMWLYNGCKETPENLVQIIVDEYKGRIPT